jgi:hypothetical protein
MTGNSERQQAITMLLRQLDEAVQRDAPLPPVVAAYVRRSLARWRAGARFSEAWGVGGRAGQRRRKRAEDLAASDRAIRELRRRYFGDFGITTAAREIARAGRQYEATAWRFDRKNPDAIANERHRLMAAVLQHRPSFPRQRRIFDILRNELAAFHCTKEAGSEDESEPLMVQGP